MLKTNSIESQVAQDLAGKAILFEIGAQAGILEHLEYKNDISVKHLSKSLNISEDFIKTFFDIFENLGLIQKSQSNDNEFLYNILPSYSEEKNKIGYISWGMVSCAPLLMNTNAFTRNFHDAVEKHTRCGEHVARTSKWMGEIDFYPHAENIIKQLNPKKVIDLGSGTCGLLIRLVQLLPGLQGVGVDISKDACNKAMTHLKELRLDNQIKVVLSPIQNLINDPEVFRNADVVHAGFVFHDLLPDEEETLDKLLSYINKAAPDATLVIVDAVPFSQNDTEISFSSAFTFLHKFFMGRKLLSELEWQNKLNKAGFQNVQIHKLGISGGRIFIAKM